MAMDIPIPNVGRQLTKEKPPDMMKGNMLLLSFPVSIILMRVPYAIVEFSGVDYFDAGSYSRTKNNNGSLYLEVK